MVNRVDGVILGVGIVVLVASVIGVVLYDEQSPQSYTISWGESEAMELEEQTDAGGPGEFTFPTEVTQDALARAEFNVQVSASGPNLQDDSVEVEVQAPGNGSGSCSFTIGGGATSGSGDCTAEVEVNPRPDVSTANGVNTSDAEMQAIGEANVTQGIGEWTTTVTIDGGTELSDPDYDVTLTPTVYTWDAQASQEGAGGRAG